MDSHVEKQEDSVYMLTFLNKRGPHDGVYTHYTPGSDRGCAEQVDKLYGVFSTPLSVILFVHIPI